MIKLSLPGATALCLMSAAALAGDARNLAGWPVNIGSCHNTSPVAADVNGDGRMEVVAVNWQGKLYLLDSRGRTVSGFPLSLGSRCGSNGAPALADVNGDGAEEIIVAAADGRLFVYDRQGRPVAGWPQTLAPDAHGAAVQDFTSYRGLEIFAAAGKKVYAYHADGVPVSAWPVEMADPAVGTPAVGDINGNRTPEVVAAAGNQVYVFGTSGTPLPGWPARLEGLAATVPVIADVDGDGRGEILIGTAAGNAYILRSDGTPLTGWPQLISSKPITAPAAVGDLGDEGELTVVFVAGSPGIAGATIAALDIAGRPRTGFPKQLNQPVSAAPLIVDADGDGTPEILVTTYDGSLIAFDKNGALAPGYPIKLSGSGVTATPVAADLDDDGLLDVVVAGQNGNVEAVATEAAFESSANPWPMWGGDAWHTSKFFGTGVARRDFTLTARRGEVAVRWQAEPRTDRRGWAIVKARKETASPLVYEEIAYIEEQSSATYTYRDAQVEDGVIYYYKIEERLVSGASITNGPKTVRAVGATPKAASLITRCYPNPFTSQVNISYQIGPAPDGRSITAVVSVYDISGKLVKNLLSETKSPGEYLADWDGTDARGTPVASGVYLVSLRTGRLTAPATKTIVLVR